MPPLIVLCLLLDLGLTVAYAVVFLLDKPIGYFLSSLIDLDAEANLTSWYSSVKLFLTAVLLFGVVGQLDPGRERLRRLLILLGLAFLAMSIDEISGIHEWLGHHTDVVLPGGKREGTIFEKTGIWIVLIGVPVLVVGLLLLRTIGRELNMPSVIRRLVIGLVVFIASATGMDLFANFVEGDIYILAVCGEELGEMIGVTIMLWAVYDLHREFHPPRSDPA